MTARMVTQSSKAPEATKAAEPVNAAAKPEPTKETSNNNSNSGGNKSSGSTKINTLVDSRCGPSGATGELIFRLHSYQSHSSTIIRGHHRH